MKPKVYRFDVGKVHSIDSRYRLFVPKADYDRLLGKYKSLQENYKGLSDRYRNLTIKDK